MDGPKTVAETIPIECSCANAVAVIEKWVSRRGFLRAGGLAMVGLALPDFLPLKAQVRPDTAKDIDALDCKSNPQNFERLLRFLIESFAKRHQFTPNRLCDLVPEPVMRAAVRKAVNRYKARSYGITSWAKFRFNFAVWPHLVEACSSAYAAAFVEKCLQSDTVKDIDALDCKANARNFETLLRFFIGAWARSQDLTPEEFCQLVPEHIMRAAVRKAVDRDKYRSRRYGFTTYASWRVHKEATLYLVAHGLRLPSKRRRTKPESPALR